MFSCFLFLMQIVRGILTRSLRSFSSRSRYLSTVRSPIPLGTKVKCQLTGLEGWATRFDAHLTRCAQIAVQPDAQEDGTKATDGYLLDSNLLIPIPLAPTPVTTIDSWTSPVKLGTTVQCQLTGFKGVAVVLRCFFDGVVRVQVQPRIRPDGTMPVSEILPASHLQVMLDQPDFSHLAANDTQNPATNGAAPSKNQDSFDI